MSLTSLFSNSSSSESSAPAPGRSKAWLLPIALLLGFIAIFALLFGERFLPSDKVRTARVMALRESGASATASAASANPDTLLFQASGWLEPDPYAIQVPALVNGVVEEVEVLEGDSVKKGQLLATLVDDEAQLAVQKAERKLDTIRAQTAAHCSQVPEINARLASANATLRAEKARLAELADQAQRLRKLPDGAVPVGEVTTAELQLDRQQARVEEAESEIPRIEAQLNTVDYQRITMGNTFREAESEFDAAQLALDRHEIYAPVDGRILHLHVQPGKKRMMATEDPKSAVIVELYRPDQMQARIDVPLNEAAGLAVGQPVKLSTDLLSDLTLEGTVTRITGQADIQRNTLQVKVAIENPDDRLRPEMLVRARFFPLPKENPEPKEDAEESNSSQSRLTLYAPADALFDIEGNSAKAWVVDSDQHARQRTLTLGPTRRDGYREIRDGLRAGEQVVLPPFANLSDGTRLEPQITEISS